MRAALVLIMLLVTGFFVTPASAAGAEDAKAFVTKVADDALAVLRTDASASQKQSQLETMFVQNVDIDWISKFVLGKYARSVTPEQMTQYKTQYQTFIVKHYTSHFDEYSGETVNVNDVRDEGDGQFFLSTQIVRPRQQNLNVDYRVRSQADGGFKITDIIFEGVSMIATQRSEFGSVISRQGMDYLIQQLAARNSNPNAKSASDLGAKAQSIQ